MVSHGRPGMGACLAGALLAGAVGSATPVAAAPDCRVRNVTQDSYGHSLIRMVQRAEDGDRLWVKGTCPGPIHVRMDMTIRGRVDAQLTGQDSFRVVRVVRGARAVLRNLVVRDGRPDWDGFGGGGILNLGELVLRDVIVQDSEASYGGGIQNARIDHMAKPP